MLVEPMLSWMDTRLSQPYDHQDESVAYVTNAGNVDAQESWELNSSTSVLYFLAPQVAIGPELRWITYLDSDDPTDSLSIGYNVQIHF